MGLWHYKARITFCQNHLTRTKMQKDFKTGLFVGLILTAVAAVCFSIRPANSIKPSKTPVENKAEKIRYKAKLPTSTSKENYNSTQKNEPLYKQTQLENFKPDSNGKNENDTKPKIHIVKKDETLSSIAFRYYGSSKYWRKIFNANRSRLKTPDKLRTGTRLIIPQ